MPAIAGLAPPVAYWGFRGARSSKIIRNEQRRLIFRPIDDVEKHSAPNHFSFESSLPDAKLAVRAEMAERIISGQGATNAMCIMVKLAFVNA